MPNVNIESKLYEDIKEYCKLNKITINAFINDLVKRGFIIEKYDEAPPFFKKNGANIHTPEEFKQECLQEPEPVKRKEYVKPEVLSVEEKPNTDEMTAKERARLRTKYL